MYDCFSGFIKLWCSERNTENTMSHFHFDEESDYSKENACDNEVFRSTILCHRKKLNIHTSASDMLHTAVEWDISIGANTKCSHWRPSVKKGVLKNFSKFAGKHLFPSLFLLKLQASSFFTEQLRTTAFEVQTL